MYVGTATGGTTVGGGTGVSVGRIMGTWTIGGGVSSVKNHSFALNPRKTTAVMSPAIAMDLAHMDGLNTTSMGVVSLAAASPCDVRTLIWLRLRMFCRLASCLCCSIEARSARVSPQLME